MGKYSNAFFISADLAQVNDYTAITIIEEVETRSGEVYNSNFGYVPKEITRELHLRHIERPERGTTYPKIVERIKELYNSPQIKSSRTTVIIDITGVGRPVWDLMKSVGFRYQLKGISITGGDTVTEENNIFRVPKRDLISALQVAFQNGALKIAAGLPEADALVKELTNFKVKININGNDQYEAWREGIHDDIVLSAAMGVWYATKSHFNLYHLIT